MFTLHPRLSFCLLSAALVLVSCAKDPLSPDAPDRADAHDEAKTAGPGFQAEVSGFYTDFFDRKGGGWTGGDGAYSIPLPDGRILWTFGDSFLDTVYADYSRPFAPLVNNTFVIQDGDDFTTLVGGTLDQPQAYVVPDSSEHFYWPADGTVFGNKVYMFMSRLRFTGAGGPFGFEQLGTDLAVFDLPGLNLVALEPFARTSAGVVGGATLFEDESYLYIYSTKKGAFLKNAFVARMPHGDLHSIEYFDGTQFVSSVWDSRPMVLDNGENIHTSNMFSVFPHQGKYYLLTQADVFGADIYLYKGDTPMGPWGNRKTVYTTPETGGDIWTYNAVAHPEIVDPVKGILVSYSVNSFDFLDLFADARIYRPRFIWVKPG